ncbi:NAD(P)H-quinone oxidoreductase [Emcibacter nanhaiensis]|uniref:NAD(P)H-quinone oxidoreductase n=1 Tax=Emcibacter nanhaiensis TaxID=1505037 RepID=A0A501PGZ3_9PROT|nr:NAD(P)H-quinone oxidoreductase [Emcibacter nanhaiensis]TPD59730.1 NAD(P)H-quinone oxidoreductase [Emcibacter nanhaiensis]
MSVPLPENMQVIEIAEADGTPVLKPAERPLPAPKEGEVLIRVAAAGVNRPDIMQRKGLYPPPPGASDIPGLEVAGMIVAVGKNVERWKIGDEVCALVTGGGYAGYCAAPAGTCLPVPDGLGMAQAAALPETFFTVWSNVFDRGALNEGETFMVHGGTSGIGTTAIQLAKAFGATVIATCGSDEKCTVARDLGADLAINYKSQDFVEEVKGFTGGRGVDVLLDMVAGDYVDRNLKVMAEDGRLVMIAVQKGPRVEVNVLPIMLKRLTFTGSTLRAREVAFKQMIAEKLEANVWPLLSEGKVKPLMGRSFALDEADGAHAWLESGENAGKIVLTV